MALADSGVIPGEWRKASAKNSRVGRSAGGSRTTRRRSPGEIAGGPAFLADDLAVSHWTRVEFASLLSREVRMGNPDAAAALKAGSRFETMVEESFVVLLPNRDDFDRARDRINRFETGPRAGDALHLAIASNRAADAIHSPDKRMIAAGERLGLPASTGVRLPGDGE